MVSRPPDAPDAAWRLSTRKRVELAAIATVVPPVLAALGRSWTWSSSGAARYDEVVASGRAPIMAFWHGRILASTYYFRHRGIVVMASENFDGEWISRVITRFGYGVARGSSSRGGARALVAMRRDMRAGRSTAFTLDGPRGPRGRAKPGALVLAKVTGNPILPFHIEGSPAWTMRSWDRAQIPKPFARVAVAIGEPFYVSESADDAAIESRRQDLERELASLEQQARDQLVREGSAGR